MNSTTNDPISIAKRGGVCWTRGTLHQSSCKGLLWQTHWLPHIKYTLFQNGHHAEKNWRELHENEVIRVKCLFRTVFIYSVAKKTLKAKENSNVFCNANWLTFLFLFHPNWPLWLRFRATRASFFPWGGHSGIRYMVADFKFGQIVSFSLPLRKWRTVQLQPPW